MSWCENGVWSCENVWGVVKMVENGGFQCVPNELFIKVWGGGNGVGGVCTQLWGVVYECV